MPCQEILGLGWQAVWLIYLTGQGPVWRSTRLAHPRRRRFILPVPACRGVNVNLRWPVAFT